MITKPETSSVTPKPAKRFVGMYYSSHAKKLRLLTLHLAKARDDLNSRVSWFAELLLFKWIMSRWELEI